MYVKSQADSVTIVLPIHMHDSNDPTIAITFLQEFAGKFFTIDETNTSPADCDFAVVPA